MRKYAVLACFLALGCSQAPSQTETIYLAKGDSVVRCGPYASEKSLGQTLQRVGAGFQGNLARYDAAHAGDTQPTTQLRQCVTDFQKAGYDRIPAPAGS